MTDRFFNRDRNRFYDEDFDEGYYDQGPYGRGRHGWQPEEGFDSDYGTRDWGQNRGSSSNYTYGQGRGSGYGRYGGYSGQYGQGTSGWGRSSGEFGSGSTSGGYGRSYNHGMYGGEADYDDYVYQNYGRNYGRAENQGWSGSQREYGNRYSGQGGYRGSGYNRGSYRYGPQRVWDRNVGYGSDLDEDFDNHYDYDFDTMPTSWTYTEVWMIPGPYTGIGPQGYQRSDERIRDDIHERLTQHGRLNARDIQVEVNNCEVTLKGSVQSREMKRMAEDIVESVSGVKDIHNQLRVQQQGQFGKQQGQIGQQSQQEQPQGQQRIGQRSSERS